MEISKKTSIFELMETLGLDLSAESGGSFIPQDLNTTVETIQPGYHYEFLTENGDTVKIVNNDIFLKSIQVTEENLKVKLFT